ncbi:MAG: glycosyl transferase [Litorilinea sp.]|nr:MAG: glycosyl transferase [Litorilinea sp.]
MRILHVNASDVQGGAARASYRLHTALRRVNHDSVMLTQHKRSDDVTVFQPPMLGPRLVARMQPHLDGLPLKLYPHRRRWMWSLNFLPYGACRWINRFNADIVNLHWIGTGFVSITDVAAISAPIVWTFHDMWPFTGGCHIDGGCGRFRLGCGYCPQLHSERRYDLSYIAQLYKKRAWAEKEICVVTPSHWLADCARESLLFQHRRIEVIPHGLDLHLYKPHNKALARDILVLPQDKQIILFGAIHGLSSPNKGFAHLHAALQRFSNIWTKEDVIAVIFGESEPPEPPNFGLQTRYLGTLNDDVTLSLVYSAADVLVIPSQQESFGLIALEAMACGTPVVSFDTSGLRDIVEHHGCGYRARCFSSEDLAEGIRWVLEDNERRIRLAQRARRKVEKEFSLELQAARYVALYEDILRNRTQA